MPNEVPRTSFRLIDLKIRLQVLDTYQLICLVNKKIKIHDEKQIIIILLLEKYFCSLIIMLCFENNSALLTNNFIF